MTEKGWQVYILRCRDDTLYTGITNNLERRLQQHNQGVAARYTRSRRPVTLAYLETAKDRAEASRREAEIKKLSRRAKLEMTKKGVTIQPTPPPPERGKIEFS